MDKTESHFEMCKEIAELCGCYYADYTFFLSGVLDDIEVINPKELQRRITKILKEYGWKHG